MRLLWAIAALAAVAAMSGCALFQAEAPAPVVAAPAPAPTPGLNAAQENVEVSALLAYYQELLALPPVALRDEYQDVSRAFAGQPGELARLRLALLLCVPGAAWRDDARLLALLDGAASLKAPTDSPRRRLVVLLQKLVAERQRERRRADELQQKLDAMVTIERSLRERRLKNK